MGNLLVTAVWIGRMNDMEFLIGLFYGMIFGLVGGGLVYLLCRLVEK
ncbi:hypothetical protein ACFSKI_19050 [Pseudogracilibacillus auburnensis]|uniref:Uncharacterized protein n=1 Tax=Pseudogracilibacillus auburnensis TaxID=1494959 RepID=A0A2V3W6I6_9BACI|nr:hypothetical protein [Pseudogracilibacillus auburnensis]MBO1005632.1 hypothetical protein [Pseudogracilibacillus auburnensis]PXW88794.1 hypothetical protein DFR56_103300 [Pseudogracilibacillus auburnensis]